MQIFSTEDDGADRRLRQARNVVLIALIVGFSGVLAVYFAIHLNAGAIIVYQATGEIVRLIPYLVWFFPLIVFQQRLRHVASYPGAGV